MSRYLSIVATQDEDRKGQFKIRVACSGEQTFILDMDADRQVLGVSEEIARAFVEKIDPCPAADMPPKKPAKKNPARKVFRPSHKGAKR
jgi:hypothetical protein